MCQTLSYVQERQDEGDTVPALRHSLTFDVGQL